MCAAMVPRLCILFISLELSLNGKPCVIHDFIDIMITFGSVILYHVKTMARRFVIRRPAKSLSLKLSATPHT